MNVSMFISGGEFRGIYTSGTVYRRKNIVTFEGFAYQATADNFSGVSPTTTTHWDRMLGAPLVGGLIADSVEAVSATTTGAAAGTRKYWFGQEWVLEKPATKHVRLKKVYQNCDCNCNCVSNCDCVNNQPNCSNCSYNNGNGLACNCACLFQSNCNYASGNCNCTPNCADGNCYI